MLKSVLDDTVQVCILCTKSFACLSEIKFRMWRVLSSFKLTEVPSVLMPSMSSFALS